MTWSWLFCNLFCIAMHTVILLFYLIRWFSGSNVWWSHCALASGNMIWFFSPTFFSFSLEKCQTTHTAQRWQECVCVCHSRVSYLMGDSEGCSQANVLIDTTAPLGFTHSSYRSQTWQTQTDRMMSFWLKASFEVGLYLVYYFSSYSDVLRSITVS